MALEDIAGYSLRRRLGSGSGGTVWLVRDLASGRSAVLKRVPTTTIALTEELRENLTVLQRIDHPHIAGVLEIRESGTEWLLFSQYVVAGTLSGLLSRRGPLTTGELVTLLSPLAEALDHLHRTGLTHGRVDPANIMFDADGRPVLTDAILHTYREPLTPTGDTTAAEPTWAVSPTNDLSSLATVARGAGGDPRSFTPDLFTTKRGDQLARHLLTLADPTPINLAFTQDPTAAPTTTDPTTPATADSTSASDATETTTGNAVVNPTTPPRPRPTAPSSTTDGSQERSRGPLAASPPEPTTADSPQATPPQPSPTKPAPSSAGPRRRNRSLRAKLTGRSRAPAPASPLGRLTTTPPGPTAPAEPPGTTAASGHTRTPQAIASASPQPDPMLLAGTAVLPPAESADSTSGVAGEGDGPTSSPIASARRRFTHPAYGVLAAVGAAAVIVLVIGLVAVGALDNPNSKPAAADRIASTAESRPQKPTAGQDSPGSVGSRSPGAGQGAVAGAGEWVRTLQALDAQRAQAFWALDAGILDKVYVRGSGPWSADRAMLMEYRKQQVRVRGLRIRIESTSVERRTASTVTLRTVDHLVGGELVDRTGAITPLPPGTPTTRLITLTTAPTNPTWRITTITSP